MKERNYCVYQHTNKVNGKRYIGITGQAPENRWSNGYGYIGCPYFWAAIQKYGWDGFEHNILFDNLLKEEAEQKEIDLIEQYNLTDERYGYNVSRGGLLSSSKYVYQYDRFSGDFIKKWDNVVSAEYVLKIPNADISAVCLGKVKTAHNFYFTYDYLGEHLPDDIYNWININDCAAPIAQYDLDGRYIASYKSIADASRAISGGASDRFVQMNNKTSCGYIWKYMFNDSIDYTIDLSEDELPKNDPPINSKWCYQYDSDGKFITSYISTIDAAKKLGVAQSPIAYACRTHRMSYDSYWRYADDVSDSSDLTDKDLFHLHGLSKSIYKYDLQGNLVEKFLKVSDAAKACGSSTSNIAKCCNGKLKKVGGFIYRYEPTTFTEEELLEINTHSYHFTPVACCDMEMNIIKMYNSMSNASRNTGIAISGIQACCSGRQSTTIDKKDKNKRYKWKYV